MPCHDGLDAVFTDASAVPELNLAEIAANAFLKVYRLPLNRAGRTSPLAHLTNLALRDPLDLKRRNQAQHTKARAQWAGIAAVETRHYQTARKEHSKDRPQQK